MQNYEQRRYSTHPLNKRRNVSGEFHHLYTDLREHPDKFFNYMRMSVETFDYIVFMTYGSLSKKWRNCHGRPIMTEERLMLTIRYSFINFIDFYYITVVLQRFLHSLK